MRPGRERHESLSVTHSCFSYVLRYVVAMAMLVLIVAVQIAPVEELVAVIAMVCSSVEGKDVKELLVPH